MSAPVAERTGPSTWDVQVEGRVIGTITEHRGYGAGNRPRWHYTFEGRPSLPGRHGSRDALLRALQRLL